MGEDRFIKYTKLYLLIFFSFLMVPVIIALLLGVFYGFSRLISSRPFDFMYALFIIALPATLYSTVYYIFLKRTKNHPSAPIKIISQILLISGLCCCITVLSFDIFAYIKNARRDIIDYKSFSLLFLAGNIGLFLFLAIIQALTTNKEEDWLDKRRRLYDDVA